MAGENIESEEVAAELNSDMGCTILAEQEVVVSCKDEISSSRTSSIACSGKAISAVNGEIDEKAIERQGVHYPLVALLTIIQQASQWEGYNGVSNQLDDHRYLNTGNCSSKAGISAGHFQHPVSYYSQDSTYGGNVTNGGTTAICGSVKSAAGHNLLVKSSGYNSINTNKTLDDKKSTSPWDVKSQRPTASSNFSKSILHNHPCQPLDKFGSGFQSAGPVKGFQPVGKFTSFTNPKQGWFSHNGQLNNKPYGRGRNGNDCFTTLGEKSNRNGDFRVSTEQTHGPRAHSRSNSLKSTAEGDQLAPPTHRDQYNLDDFQTQYDNAKFYVIKSYSEDDVHKSMKYDVWSSTPYGNKKLDAAFNDAEANASETSVKCPLFLFFSVNGSRQFVGLAEMIGRVDFNKNMNFWQLDKWNGFFPVKWHIIKDIPNVQLRHIILENNDNRDVTYTRDTQEIGLDQGLEMLNIFKRYSGKTSLLDDFNFYENREKLLKSKRSGKPDSEKIYKKNDFPRHGETTIEDGSVATDRCSDTTSLLNLTRKLSIHAHPSQSGGAVTRDN